MVYFIIILVVVAVALIAVNRGWIVLTKKADQDLFQMKKKVGVLYEENKEKLTEFVDKQKTKIHTGSKSSTKSKTPAKKSGSKSGSKTSPASKSKPKPKTKPKR